jgi:hypothetical protein
LTGTPTVLLGPQRFDPNLRSVVDALGIGGAIAAVTAGWQEREAEDGELSDHLGSRRVVNLALYRRSERVFAEDAELFAAHRRRQERLRELQQLYRLRLDHALGAARALAVRGAGDPRLVEPERTDAVEAVRALDAHHLARVRAIDRRFDQRWRPHQRPAVARHRHEIAELLAGCAALAIAGGHVAVLLNRLRLFGVVELADGLPLFAWSAGAMILARRLVLFHDSPPQGQGNAEVLETGLDHTPEVLPLPHASRRLRLDDPVRVRLFARRFAPAACLTLDAGAELVLDGRRIVAASRVGRLTAEGAVEPLVAGGGVGDGSGTSAGTGAGPGGRGRAGRSAREGSR